MNKKMIAILVIAALGAVTAFWSSGCGSSATTTPAFTMHSSYGAS